MNLKDALQLFAWEGLNPLLLRWNRHKRYAFNGRYAGINLGCGLDNPANWLGIDGGAYVVMQSIPTPILRLVYRFTTARKSYCEDEYIHRIRRIKVLHHDLGYGIPFADSSVPAIYTSHLLEHVTRIDAQRLMKECLRVLKPGGMVRIVVPSLEKQVDKMREAVSCYERGDLQPIQEYLTSNVVGYNNAYNNHRWMYNFRDLSDLLQRVGFIDITERLFREGNFPDLTQIETRGGVIIEALKGR